jgi:DNA-binding beta-propeller fold protein YncE
VSAHNNFLAASGDLTRINAVASGTDPVSIATDPVAYFVYVANQGSNDISGYSNVGNIVGGPGPWRRSRVRLTRPAPHPRRSPLIPRADSRSSSIPARARLRSMRSIKRVAP